MHICHFHNDIGQLMLAFALLFLFLFFFFRPPQGRRKFEWHQLANTEHQVHITWTPYFAGIYSFVSVIGLPQTILRANSFFLLWIMYPTTYLVGCLIQKRYLLIGFIPSTENWISDTRSALYSEIWWVDHPFIHWY